MRPSWKISIGLLAMTKIALGEGAAARVDSVEGVVTAYSAMQALQ